MVLILLLLRFTPSSIALGFTDLLDRQVHQVVMVFSVSPLAFVTVEEPDTLFVQNELITIYRLHVHAETVNPPTPIGVERVGTSPIAF
eukprot:1703918-Heterocapsa_arctica.AAC.1